MAVHPDAFGGWWMAWRELQQQGIFPTDDFSHLEFSGFQGQLVDLRVSLEYQIWRHFGMGIGYNSMSIDVSASGNANYFDFVGDIDVSFGGLLLYGKLSF